MGIQSAAPQYTLESTEPPEVVLRPSAWTLHMAVSILPLHAMLATQEGLQIVLPPELWPRRKALGKLILGSPYLAAPPPAKSWEEVQALLKGPPAFKSHSVFSSSQKPSFSLGWDKWALTGHLVS